MKYKIAKFPYTFPLSIHLQTHLNKNMAKYTSLILEKYNF